MLQDVSAERGLEKWLRGVEGEACECADWVRFAEDAGAHVGGR